MPNQLSRRWIGSLFALLLCVGLAEGQTFYVNDDSTVGDRWCSAAGHDESGDGTPELPFASVNRALENENADSIFVDTGLYILTSGPTRENRPAITFATADLAVQGAGTMLTRFVANPIQGSLVAMSVTGRGVSLSDFSVEGARVGVLLQTYQASAVRLAISGQTQFGILIDGGGLNVISDCHVWSSSFRGIQLRQSAKNVIENTTSTGNINAGFCLQASNSNTLRSNLSDRNGTSGFFVTSASASNVLGQNQSYRSGMGGFYLFGESTNNRLHGNTANWNQRGFVLKNASNNIVVRNEGRENLYADFQIRGTSLGNRLEENEGNQEDLTSNESPARAQ